MKSQKSQYLIDALSFTSRCKDHDLAFVLQLLGFLDSGITWQHIPGAKGYKERDYYDGVNINYGSDKPDQFLYVEISGQGCRVFETYGNGDYAALFEWILQTDGVQLTRIDIAFDDREGLLNLTDVRDALENGDYASRLRTWEITHDSNDGMTIYLGSKHSDMFFRFYDKAIERGYLDRSCGHWVRIELQLRHDKAEQYIKQSLSPESLISILIDLIRFLDPDDLDINKARRKSAIWWDRFIGSAERVHLFGKPGTEYNLSNLDKYVFGMSGPSVMAAVDIYGEKYFLHKLKKEAEDRYHDNTKLRNLKKQVS